MKDIFEFHSKLTKSYNDFSHGFNTIREKDIRDHVEKCLKKEKKFCPEPLIQLNMSYQQGRSISELVSGGLLHPDCGRLFVFGEEKKPLVLYTHQQEAITYANEHKNYVVTTGTGSGKSLTFIIPIINEVLRSREKAEPRRTRAVIIYPMNALANSQAQEFEKFLSNAEDLGIHVGRYTGQESQEERKKLADNPPDVLLTNYMMLEYLLTRSAAETDRRVIANCRGLAFLALDELHTYRGRQGADVALLVRRLRITTQSEDMVCVGTSATMSSAADARERRQAVAEVAAKLFGAGFSEDNIIEETLLRVTDKNVQDSELPQLLRNYLRSSHDFKQEIDAANLCTNPLAIWVERTMGTEMDANGELRRATPATLSAHADKLSEKVKIPQDDAKRVLIDFLKQASGIRIDNRTPFAFKLHQFISGPGAVSLSLEPPGQRTISLESQNYIPERTDRARFFTAYFCRECGQAHIPAWYNRSECRYTPRLPDEAVMGDETLSQLEACILTPVLSAEEQHFYVPGKNDTLPESWQEERKGVWVIKRDKKSYVPEIVHVNILGGTVDEENAPCHDFYRSHPKFPYCLHCGSSFDIHGKVSNRIYGLSIEGRSSASTVLMLSALNLMREEIRNAEDEQYRQELRKVYKILGFTDNRQDAALQAGFFNDFVHTALLRAALIRALSGAPEPMGETDLLNALQKALGVDELFRPGSITPDELRAAILNEPDAKGKFLRNAADAMRFYLGFSLITEQRYGWRRNNPNLEQLGILKISYQDVDNVVEEAAVYKDFPAWSNLSHAGRVRILCTILNVMRSKLCIGCDYLNHTKHEDYKKIRGSLTRPWRIQDGRLNNNKYKGNHVTLGKKLRNANNKTSHFGVSVSPSSAMAKALKGCQDGTKDEDFWKKNVVSKQYPELILSLFREAEKYGITEQRADNTWVLRSDAILWSIPEGQEPNKQENAFFYKLYTAMADLLASPNHGLFELEAWEHTAQVSNEERERLEERFRYESPEEKHLLPLPLLFCSPTMELGVDISSLDIVYMRNVPPTPANYAQRAGRAGRSGRAALAITYCAAAGPHDHWFFKRQNEMVCGTVNPPALDLANRDMVESHIRAIWLHAAEYQLSGAIVKILDLSDDSSYPVREEVRFALCNPGVIERALPVAEALMQSLLQTGIIPEGPEYKWARDPDFCRNCLNNARELFDRAFDNWRELLTATNRQMEACQAIMNALHGYTHVERDAANRRHTEAYRQRTVLTDDNNSTNNEFYSYRYLAGQGFIPGYDFPRLPLLAWIPGSSSDKDTSMRPLARPRFLALSEFGPFSLIYHRGSTYEVYKIKLNSHDNQVGIDLPVQKIQVCSRCGHSYFVPANESPLDVCEHCGAMLNNAENTITGLYKVETVETRPKEQINAMMEERQRQGYDLQTCYRFNDSSGQLSCSERRICRTNGSGSPLGAFTYGPSATVWRINKGWRRRADASTFGFNINPTTGFWSSDDQTNPNYADEEPPKEATVARSQRIVPYVEDRRNILIYRLPDALQQEEAAATLQAALAVGIVRTFHIESSEIIVEALPDRTNRQSLLLYEASEGGAGVLHQLVEFPDRLAQVADNALQAMHYTKQGDEWVDTGEEKCVCACYNCLLSYRNQPDHDKINRSNDAVFALLTGLAGGQFKFERVTPQAAASGGIQALLAEAGLPPADETDKPLPGGITADAFYTAASLALFRGSVPPQAEELTACYGIICLPLSEHPTAEEIATISPYLS